MHQEYKWLSREDTCQCRTHAGTVLSDVQNLVSVFYTTIISAKYSPVQRLNMPGFLWYALVAVLNSHGYICRCASDDVPVINTTYPERVIFPNDTVHASA